MYAAICVDLLISNALFELVYVLVYLSCHIFVTRAHDCLAPLYPNPGYAPASHGPAAAPGQATAHGEPRVPSGVPFSPPNPRR